ncbi:hypothetical protein JHK87_010243 [Glycine soja]|nr:hypothetical protein JHK87_010243 [Glycine soja]
MKANALSKMSNLKLLILRDVNFSDRLVELHLPHNNIKRPWKDTKAEHRYKCLERVTVCSNIQSIIAGSQIPRWFNNQHVGRRSLTSREATPLLQDFNICIGFACCAVFVLRDEMDTIEMDLLKVELYTVDISGFLEGDLIMNESDNMWLCYITRSRFLGLCRLHMLPYNDKLKLNFFIKNKRGFPIVVKKHGYRWVYEEDL